MLLGLIFLGGDVLNLLGFMAGLIGDGQSCQRWKTLVKMCFFTCYPLIALAKVTLVVRKYKV